MTYGVIGCEICLVFEAALVANFVPSENHAALQAAVAMFFTFQVSYGVALDRTMFSYIGELFPTHIRSKGVCLGVSMISLMNVTWLQSAPTAFANIGWVSFVSPSHIRRRKANMFELCQEFHLVFIVSGTIGGLVIFFFFPDTSHRPLEEIAEIFGDADELAIYQRDVQFDERTRGVIASRAAATSGGGDGAGVNGGSEKEKEKEEEAETVEYIFLYRRKQRRRVSPFLSGISFKRRFILSQRRRPGLRELGTSCPTFDHRYHQRTRCRAMIL